MSEHKQVPVEELDLRDDPEVISPPYIEEPLYECSIAVTVKGFIANADVELQIDGATVSIDPAGQPEPQGYTFVPLPPLNAGQSVRARQHAAGVVSDWSKTVVVGSLEEDFPSGLPRPQINPAPVYKCGSRTGVSNLLTGSNVWIEADGTEVGRVEGAQEQQGVNVNPDYSLNQSVRAYTEMCGFESSPSVEHITQLPPSPLPTPEIDDVYEGSEQIRIKNLVNGARFILTRNGTNLGEWRTWGGSHLVTMSPAVVAGETLTVVQRMCADESDPGDGEVKPCSELPAPSVAPIQSGDTSIRILNPLAGVTIKVFAGFEKIGEGGGSVIQLIRPIGFNETVYVIQSTGECMSNWATEVNALCVAPPVSGNPSTVDFFPIGHMDYQSGNLYGIVYYPAVDDGEKEAFHKKLATVPIVFIAHGNHAIFYNPDNREQESCSNLGGWVSLPNHLGYRYLQQALARMGIISVSINMNETNCKGGFINIEDRAELLLATVDLFKNYHAGDSEILKGHIDFDRAGFLGHSRGAEAVILAANEAPGSVEVNIKCVISLAPTDFGQWDGPGSFTPGEYPFMTILPAGDGDVWSNDGARFYDMQKPSPFKSQLYVHNANHNYFNREWPFNEGVPSAQIMTRGNHERILSAYSCALIRRFLLGANTLDYLTYRRLPAGVAHEQVHLSFEFTDQLTVDDHQQNNTITVNSLGLPTQQTNGLQADEYNFSQYSSPIAQYNNTFFGNTIGMVTECERTNGLFRTEIEEMDLPENYEIWIRVAEVSTGRGIPSGQTGFELGLEDVEGRVVWVDSDAVGGVPRPYDRPDIIKTMLKTLRFRSGCFKAQDEFFNIQRLSAILIRCNREKPRPLAFDVLQIVI